MMALRWLRSHNIDREREREWMRMMPCEEQISVSIYRFFLLCIFLPNVHWPTNWVMLKYRQAFTILWSWSIASSPNRISSLWFCFCFVVLTIWLPLNNLKTKCHTVCLFLDQQLWLSIGVFSKPLRNLMMVFIMVTSKHPFQMN